MSCNGILVKSDLWGGYSGAWVLIEFDNGKLRWAAPCIQCKSDICKKLFPDACNTRVVGRIEAIKHAPVA